MILGGQRIRLSQSLQRKHTSKFIALQYLITEKEFKMGKECE